MPLEMAVSGLERAREAREQFDAEKVFTVLGNEQCRTVLKVLQDNPGRRPNSRRRRTSRSRRCTGT
ncbi:hypothetical protein VB773_18250 [Haloarculaceae archaeon H-GB2-1]|nr:hypothetical protein [Haloarculaceae archaeon H-GB2-1]